MAPVNTMTPPTDMPDNLRQELESLSTPEYEAQFSALDTMPAIGTKEYNDTSPRVSESGIGEPIAARDLYNSDQAYELAAAADQKQGEYSSTLRNYGQRLEVLRSEY